ncbi:hypothetical protein [Aureimonas endophytica]|uniref:hypothetical protein n=1 Tax=Aureimonas endophytica TaxID=2027858 RepID=UPI00166D7A91|nr:hypothetical protein [Aureimonas endophytica]
MIINLAISGAVSLGIAVVPHSLRIAVVVAPWSPPRHVLDVIADAGGKVVRSSQVPWVALSEGMSPGYVQRLFSAGAVLVFDGSLFSAYRREALP